MLFDAQSCATNVMPDPEKLFTALAHSGLAKKCIFPLAKKSFENGLQQLLPPPFVFSAVVDLSSSLGRFEYDPTVTAPDLIKEFVEELGFKAAFSMPNMTEKVKLITICAFNNVENKCLFSYVVCSKWFL